ncbi:rhomboid family intramembrane serine protease [Lutibacter sp. TH_r2]|uniref:rhomboid family intramembrane serine protease n=1 Tax=Lutibacter sp. TH_r2 TaxID=3082083 RepID=UPI0029548D52|nr:rhomboid family intramembrane serine protease [Lutibacter sp. TH_r2]MDV7188182.1 rhomboid family intramembrane serine protease [Lutibacter sp. TH_r2]
MNKLTEAIKHLIIINVLLFIAPKLLDFDLQNLFALHFPKNPEFGLWQFITHMFMHSQFSFMHILFNMYALWAFGTPLEQMWGRNKFLFFYFSAGLGAGIIYTLVNYFQFNSAFNELIKLGASSEEIYSLMNATVQYENETLQKANEIYNTSAVGASGAVYGVLVAFGMTFPNAKLGLIFFPVPVAAKYFIPGLILLDLFSGVTGFSLFGGGVAHFAHVGGALIGFLIAYYWKQHQFRRWD